MLCFNSLGICWIEGSVFFFFFFWWIAQFKPFWWPIAGNGWLQCKSILGNIQVPSLFWCAIQNASTVMMLGCFIQTDRRLVCGFNQSINRHHIGRGDKNWRSWRSLWRSLCITWLNNCEMRKLTDKHNMVSSDSMVQICDDLYSKNIFDGKKGEPKKVQVTERLKSEITVRPRRKDISARLCRTPAYKAS